MKEVTLSLLSDLASALETDARFRLLKEEEAALSSNEGASALLKGAAKKREEYLTLRLECGEEDERVIAAKKAFHQAKLALEENSDVAAYRARYAEADAIYREIDEILFGEYRGHRSCKENHAAR